MSKFIDVDPILQQQYLGYTRVSDTEWQKGYWEGVDMICDLLRKSPTIDAVPVVRCKDCWMYEDGFCFSRYVGCGSVTPQRNPDDFCSYGELKEGSDNG